MISHKYLNHGTVIELIWTITPLLRRGLPYLSGEKLPNSGNPLKLLIPSLLWKWAGGWINCSGMVISQMIFERLMDDHGSKSAICGRLKKIKINLKIISLSFRDYWIFYSYFFFLLCIAVKEQRVDGSQHIYLTKFNMMCLRCTLMGSDRNYQAKNFYKQILQIRQLSSNRSLAIFSHTLALQSPNPNLPKLFSSLKPWFVLDL